MYRFSRRMFVAFLSGSCLHRAQAQTYPDKPIKLVTPMAPAGGLDTLARFFSKYLSKELGQPVVVENRPGANGNLGAELVARSTPDGYTLLATYIGTQAINPNLYSDLKFDAIEDFQAVAGLTKTSYVVAVHPSVQATTLKELVALAKKNPGKINYASAGSGSLGHLGAKQFEVMSEININHIPYKGTGPALMDVLAGRVELIFNTYGSIGKYIQSGALRPLATAGKHRSRDMPNVPTTAEQGFPELDVNGWYGVVAPRHTPRSVINKLNAAVQKTLDDPEVIQWLHQQDHEPFTASPDEFAAFMKSEKTKWAKVIKASGLKVTSASPATYAAPPGQVMLATSNIGVLV